MLGTLGFLPQLSSVCPHGLSEPEPLPEQENKKIWVEQARIARVFIIHEVGL